MKTLRIFPLIALLSTLVFVACEKDDEPEDPSDEVNFDRQSLLTDLSEQVKNSYINFDNSLEELNSQLSAFNDDVNTQNLENLRTAWSNALLEWQAVAPYQFGLASNLIMEESSNTFPTDVDQINGNISSGSYNLDAPTNLDATGFQAMDYLLHGIANTDADIVDLYANDALASNRLDYLNTIADQLNEKTDLLVADWESGSSSVTDFIANDGIDNGSSLGLFLNSWIQSYEAITRTNKLGTPAGALTFSMIPQPQTVEALYENDNSVAYLVQSVADNKSIYMGSNPEDVSFDTYLRELNAMHNGELLADVIVAQFEVAENSLSQLQDPLSEFVVNEQMTALEVFAELQDLVTLLKTDMMSSFAIEVTYVDTDGD
ncbi:MAG: imelysin family protein [Bacteroidota bacterium]